MDSAGRYSTVLFGNRSVWWPDALGYHEVRSAFEQDGNECIELADGRVIAFAMPEQAKELTIDMRGMV
jgi:hypothetical protein